MTEENLKPEAEKIDTPQDGALSSAPHQGEDVNEENSDKKSSFHRKGEGKAGRGRGRSRSRDEQEKKEFEEEVLCIDRVTRVVKGGRRLRFRATVIIGDRKSRVGVGIGKSAEVSEAIKKAVSSAKKQLVTVPMVKGTIPHELTFKYKAARIVFMPAKDGTGIIAGGAMRKIFDLAGVKNILGKSYGTSNKLVNGQATMLALQSFRKKKVALSSKEEK